MSILVLGDCDQRAGLIRAAPTFTADTWCAEIGVIQLNCAGKNVFLVSFAHALRRRWSKYQALLYAISNSLDNCVAEIPRLSRATRYMAQNHTVRGRCVRCITVPAVTEVCLWQCLHEYSLRPLMG